MSDEWYQRLGGRLYVDEKDSGDLLMRVYGVMGPDREHGLPAVCVVGPDLYNDIGDDALSRRWHRNANVVRCLVEQFEAGFKPWRIKVVFQEERAQTFRFEVPAGFDAQEWYYRAECDKDLLEDVFINRDLEEVVELERIND